MVGMANLPGKTSGAIREINLDRRSGDSFGIQESEMRGAVSAGMFAQNRQVHCQWSVCLFHPNPGACLRDLRVPAVR
jgi:hypothetical protein